MAGFRINTFNVTSSNSPYRIVASMNIMAVTYKMSGGTSDAGTVMGNLTVKDASGADQPSVAVALGPGEGDTIIPQSPVQPIDGLTFTVTTGTLRLLMGQ